MSDREEIERVVQQLDAMRYPPHEPIAQAAALIRRLEKERDEAVETAKAYLRRATREAKAGKKARNKALGEAKVALIKALPEIPCSCSEIVEETILALKSKEPKT